MRFAVVKLDTYHRRLLRRVSKFTATSRGSPWDGTTLLSCIWTLMFYCYCTIVCMCNVMPVSAYMVLAFYFVQLIVYSECFK